MQRPPLPPPGTTPGDLCNGPGQRGTDAAVGSPSCQEAEEIKRKEVTSWRRRADTSHMSQHSAASRAMEQDGLPNKPITAFIPLMAINLHTI